MKDIIELKLKGLWSGILKKQISSSQDTFQSLGGDSLNIVFLATAINEEFKTHFPSVWIVENPTIELQAKALRKSAECVVSYNPLICFNEKGHSLPLVLIHPALAGAEVYDELAAKLNKNIPFYAIDSYNLNSGEPFMESIEALALKYSGYLREKFPKGPYLLGGWSAGGIIAYEMAQQLTALGCEVKKVYLIDTRVHSKAYLEYLCENINRETVLEALPDKLSQYLASLPKKYHKQAVRSLKQDYLLLERYKIRPYFNDVLLFKTTHNNAFVRFLSKLKDNPWKPYAKSLEIIPIVGDHFNIIEGEQALQLAEALEKDIEFISEYQSIV